MIPPPQLGRLGAAQLDAAPLDETGLKIAWDRLQAVANEAATTLFRTAFSVIVRELIDIGFAILDPTGRLIVTGDIGTPGHINPLSAACRRLIEISGDDLAPGDVLVLNDPWHCSGHLLDIAVVTPLYASERLIGFAANICHYTDVGGLGATFRGTSVYEEGLFIPGNKLVSRGQRDEGLWRLILSNVRRNGLFAGDMEAAITANTVATRGVARLLDDLGLEDLDWIASEVIGRTEVAMRDAIRALKPGRYTNVANFDPLDEAKTPRTLAIAIEVEDDTITVDYAGTSSQLPYGVNSTLVYTTAYTQYAMRLAVTSNLPNNHGTLAPIRVVAPEGSMVAAKYPAATALRSTTAMSLPPLLLATLAPADPPYCMADSAGGPIGMRAGEISAMNAVLFAAAGTGARKDRDGLDGRIFPARVKRGSIEMFEQEGYYRVVRYERRRGSGGAGKYRGGDGVVVEVEMCRSGEVDAGDATPERVMDPPRGVNGGEPGLPPHAYHNGREIAFEEHLTMHMGDRLTYESAGGGGWGTPDGE